MAITLAKIALTYILGGIMAVTALVAMSVPVYFRLSERGKDWDEYVDKAFELLDRKYGGSSPYSKLDNMSVGIFFAIVAALWPIAGPITAVMFDKVFTIMLQRALQEES